MTQADWDVYMERNQRDASSLTSNYDVVFLHDPQSATMRQFVRASEARWMWRYHIDTSAPDA